MSSPAPFGFLPPGALSGLRRSVIDPETGNPVVTSAPTGEVVQRSAVLPVGRNDDGRLTPAVPGLIADAPQSIASALTLPRDAWRGDVQTQPTMMSADEGRRVADLAGTAMTGSLPFGAPKGALRMFGGIGKDDPLAALEAGLADLKPAAPSPGPRLMDPNAKAWDLYHGSNAGPDFKRFDPHAGDNPAERGGVFFAPDPETASGYAATGSARAGDAGQRVFRTTVEPGKTDVFDISHLAETDPAFNARAREITVADGGERHGPLWDQHMENYRANRAQDADIARQIVEMGFTPDPNAATRMSFGHGHIAAAVERAKAQGLDTAILRGLVEHGGDDQVIALTPGRVRSFYAPDQLLYSGGPGGALPGALALTAPGAAQAASSSPSGSKGPPMTSGIPFGFGFGAMPISNADPDDPRRFLQRLPFDPAQVPGPTDATDLSGPAGALVHHPGWSATGTGAGRQPAVAMDEAETQRLEAQAGSGAGAGGPGVQVGRQGQYPGLAELFDRSPMGAPQAFEGTSGTIVPGQGAAPQAVPLPPARPTDLGISTDAPERPPTRYTGLGPSNAPAPAAPAASPAAPTEAPPARPQFGSLAGYPAPGGAGSAQQAQAPAAAPAPMQPPAAGQVAAPAADDAGPGVLSRLGDPRVYNTLLGIGQGLLTTKGLGPGLAAGTAYASKLNKDQAATDLAQAEYGLKARKAAQEQAQLTANARFVQSKIPGISADQALALGGNSTFVGELFKGALPPSELYKQYTDADGNRWSRNERTGQETIALKAETDKTQTPLTDPEARAKAGIAPNDKRPAWSDPDGKITFNEGPKAQTSTMIGPDGTKATRVYNPATGAFDAPDYGGNPPRSSIDTSDVPPGVDPATYRKELAKGAAAERKGASAKAIQAADAMPILDRAETAYKRLGENGGIGPISASGPSRMVAGAFGRQNEIDRQEYEAAAKELELLKAQISMKGQGSITEGERHILRMTLPRLDAASPGTGLTTLQGMRDQFTRAMNADRLPSRGAPSPRSDPSTPAQPARQFGPIPGGAAQALQRDPSLREQFDAKYGAGAADNLLRGR